MKINLLLLTIFGLNLSFSYAQTQETPPPEYIKTIQFKGSTAENQLPIIPLGDPITIEFDALNGDEDDFYYKIKYYNRDWTPSVLIQTEYMDGFDNQRIREYENSFNTYQIFSHYRLTIPNDQTRGLKISGNYMLFIYNGDNELMFSQKFMIYEKLADVGIVLKRARDISNIEEKQRVELTVASNRIQFNNPTQTVNAVIIQNNNLKTAITDVKPQYVLGNQLVYKYDSETSFWAGNEYLFFENKDVRGANNNIQFIDLQDLYHNYLFTNQSRANQPYTYYPDINGNYVINNIDASDPSIEADYVWVHFSLLADENLKNKDIHVYGTFNNYAIEDLTRMTYDASKNIFTGSILLKQGFYNYKYVAVDSNGSIDENLISGNFWQTENNYKVLVYYRDLGARYDRIIGVNEGTSINISN
ncbi:DUF5103 domain-containing protein [Pseudotamlana carrageenivorans]|uniref:DUF5103 domain-containing protein n=1 Tax=Pseudotamlana carrageenivorans TaxID=2069432 RepID=A0A2I7SJD6_9FLAO|nr:DUF5103 domain-containing protein [Tamlana carrageenivorans]AUS06016.1 DUF5103 domain-containing protein [Tamlana carrageenivorans]